MTVEKAQRGDHRRVPVVASNGSKKMGNPEGASFVHSRTKKLTPGFKRFPEDVEPNPGPTRMASARPLRPPCGLLLVATLQPNRKRALTAPLSIKPQKNVVKSGKKTHHLNSAFSKIPH